MKNIVLMVLVLIVLSVGCAAIWTRHSPDATGDLNGDGIVDVTDTILAARAIKFGDMNGNCVLDQNDVSIINRKAAGEIIP